VAVLETFVTGDSDGADGPWRLLGSRVDASAFRRGLIGAYRMGPKVRHTQFGEVVLALHTNFDVVLELDLLDRARDTPLVNPDGLLLADLSHVLGLKHRHIAPTVGVGIDDGVPYVARPFRMGRTLAEVLSDDFSWSQDLAASVLYAVAEGLSFLEQQGPMPGVCVMGGFGAEDIYLRFDGGVELVGTGLRRLRGTTNPIEADAVSFRALVTQLATAVGRPFGVPEALSVPGAGVWLRRHFREACGTRTLEIGRALRQNYRAMMLKERRFFGLPTLH
jgi:serine/threonine protein kinase